MDDDDDDDVLFPAAAEINIYFPVSAACCSHDEGAVLFQRYKQRILRQCGIYTVWTAEGRGNGRMEEIA